MVFVALTFVLLIVDEVQGKVKMEYGTMEYGSKPVAELIRNAEGNERTLHDPDQGLIDSGFDVIALCRLSKKDRNG